MNDNSLYTAILNQGQEEALKVLNEAKAEVAQIKSANEAKVALEREKALKAIDSEDEEVRRTNLASYDLEGRQKQLKARKELLEGVQKEALITLNNLDDKALNTLVIAIIKKSGAKGNEVLRISATDRDRYVRLFGADLHVLNQALNMHLTLGEPTSINGGFILEGQAFDIDASFAGLVQELCEAKEQTISALLFNMEA